MKHVILWVSLTLAGCAQDPGQVGTNAQSLTEGQVNALNNVGRDTGITYQLVDPPEPDQPILQMWLNPVTDLQRVSTYLDLAGGLSQTVTADPPGSAPQPALPTTDIHDSEGNLLVTVTGDPPGGVTGDPPGGAPVSCTAFGSIANGTLNFASDRTLNFALGNTTTSVIVTADPPGSADPPGGLNFSVHLVGAGTVRVYQDGATSPSCTTSSTVSPITVGGS